MLRLRAVIRAPPDVGQSRMAAAMPEIAPRAVVFVRNGAGVEMPTHGPAGPMPRGRLHPDKLADTVLVHQHGFDAHLIRAVVPWHHQNIESAKFRVVHCIELRDDNIFVKR